MVQILEFLETRLNLLEKTINYKLNNITELITEKFEQIERKIDQKNEVEEKRVKISEQLGNFDDIFEEFCKMKAKINKIEEIKEKVDTAEEISKMTTNVSQKINVDNERNEILDTVRTNLDGEIENNLESEDNTDIKTNLNNQKIMPRDLQATDDNVKTKVEQLEEYLEQLKVNVIDKMDSTHSMINLFLTKQEEILDEGSHLHQKRLQKPRGHYSNWNLEKAEKIGLHRYISCKEICDILKRGWNEFGYKGYNFEDIEGVDVNEQTRFPSSGLYLDVESEEFKHIIHTLVFQNGYRHSTNSPFICLMRNQLELYKQITGTVLVPSDSFIQDQNFFEKRYDLQWVESVN